MSSTATSAHPSGRRPYANRRVGSGTILTRRELALFNRIPSTICVPAGLVPYVRSGLVAEFGSATDALEAALEGDEVDPERWRAGLTQLDGARELLTQVGVSAGPDEFGLNLEVATPRLARLLLDALRAVYDVEVQRLADAAATDHVQIPLREIPVLRHLIVDAERRLDKAGKRLEPILDASEKRTPRSVKFPK